MPYAQNQMHHALKNVPSSNPQDQSNSTRIIPKPLHIKPSERKYLSPNPLGMIIGMSRCELCEIETSVRVGGSKSSNWKSLFRVNFC